jgi:site-specific DNA recombinase
MTRVPSYARYSSDNQRDASIEDQLRICREKAEREKWTVVSTYKDAGISGASMILRPSIQTLLQDAQRQQFDVVLAEALDRISRDQADVATLFKHLRFAGVSIITLAEGEISELHVGLGTSGYSGHPSERVRHLSEEGRTADGSAQHPRGSQ